MAKPKESFPRHAVFVEWGKFKIGASGAGIFAVVALGAEILLARYLGLW
jgi:hypothetical protein